MRARNAHQTNLNQVEEAAAYQMEKLHKRGADLERVLMPLVRSSHKRKREAALEDALEENAKFYKSPVPSVTSSVVEEPKKEAISEKEDTGNLLSERMKAYWTNKKKMTKEQRAKEKGEIENVLSGGNKKANVASSAPKLNTTK